MRELQFPLERKPAMYILGLFWTGYIPGTILVGIMLFIGIFFLGNQQFSIISIILFFIFFLPFALVIHMRLVRQGKKLLKDWCLINFDPETKTMEIETGFPNTMNPDTQTVTINEDNQHVVIKGDEIGGYHLRLGKTKNIHATRLGLWVDLQEAKSAAETLVEFTGGEIIDESKSKT